MQVNQSFDVLRKYVQHLPGQSKKKLSKVDTLRGAVDYIRLLQSWLAETDNTAPSAASHHPTEQLHVLSTHQYPQQQQPQFAAVDDVTSPSSGFFVSLLQTGVNSSIESHDVIAASSSGLLATASTPLDPVLSYSTESASLPVTDVNANNYFVTEPCPPWSPQVDISRLSDTTEYQQRLNDINDITAWLLGEWLWFNMSVFWLHFLSFRYVRPYI